MIDKSKEPGRYDEQYFAAKEAKDVASVVLDKSQTFFNFLRYNAYINKINRSWRFYHGAFNQSVDGAHQVDFSGEQGELVMLPINHYRNIAQHIYTMITANRPVMDARAVNTDAKSMAQAAVANQILDYYMREKRLEEAIKKASEMSIVLGAGFIKLAWNATAGDIYDADPETGELNYEGELEFTTHSPLDVVVDGTKEGWDNDWILVRSFVNRYNLIAKYPELREKLLGIPTKNQSSYFYMSMWSNDQTDDVAVYEFFHRRTEAMPEGRYLLFCDSETVMIDMKMPYRTIPIFRIAPSDIMGTPYGYSPMFDLMPIQEQINALYSAVATNQAAFAVQNVFVPRGSDLTTSALEGGLNIIEGNAKPEAVQLTSSPKEVLEMIQMMEKNMEVLSGVNSVARGDPEKSLRSGTSLALVQSMALQFISGLQQSYVRLVEDVGTAVVQILKDFATTPKTIALVGKYNQWELKQFTGEDINSINRVIVDVGNPLSKCLALDTPVLMYDGTIKAVQYIRVDDQIMGPDSKPRTVSSIARGQEMMYEVVSKDENRGIKYGCNESHILTLKYCSDDYRYNAKKGDIIDISIKEYNQLTGRQKRLLQGFTTGIEFQEKDLPIPAYILGLWLGDGSSNSPTLTSMDEEIVSEWCDFANKIGLSVRISSNGESNKSKNYHITSGIQNGRSDRNAFTNELRLMEVLNNKHIPHFYKTASRTQRLELLAGLIDTDGHRVNETFIFTQKNNTLTNDVVYLAKSLGFRVTTRKFKAKFSSKGTHPEGEYNKVSIGGNTWEIPVRLPRKKVTEKTKARDHLNYGIDVIPVGYGDYYGFTLKEEPHFVLGDFTVTHNTLAGRVQMAEQMLQMQILKNPQQYIEVMNTGRLDAMYQGDQKIMLSIRRENEKLMEGKPVRALATDKHKSHIDEHTAILSDPDLREDQELAANVLAHIQEHIDLLRNTDPALLMMLGEQPLPPLSEMQPQPPGGAPGEPQGDMPTQGSIDDSTVPQTMQPGQMAPPPPGTQVSGPGNPEGAKLPQPSKVPANLLPNPAAQEQAMGNLK